MPTSARVLLPPLREGDRLSSDEFIRRWEAMPDLKHAELIEGIVSMASPVLTTHSEHHFRICSWLAYYLIATPGCKAGNDGTWKVSDGSILQPDVAMIVLPEFGGQSSSEGGYSTGAPELIVEISVSSSSRDSGAKLRLSERAGVREYLTVLPEKKHLVWRELAGGKFREIEPGQDGLLLSRVFPGLWLNPSALWSNDLATIASTVQRGLATSEHAAFVRALVR